MRTLPAPLLGLEAGVRWTARVLSALLVGFVLVMFVGLSIDARFRPPRLTGVETVLMIFFWTSCIGMVVAWRLQEIGGALSLGGMILFFTVELAANGRFPRGFALYLMLLPVIVPDVHLGGNAVSGLDPALLRALHPEAQAYLARMAARLRACSVRVQTRVITNCRVAAAILEEAGAQAMHLIALATHGRGSLARLLLGSVADKVVRGASAQYCCDVRAKIPPDEPCAEEAKNQPVFQTLKTRYRPRASSKPEVISEAGVSAGFGSGQRAAACGVGNRECELLPFGRRLQRWGTSFDEEMSVP
jgi:nucleotide-binding universal stress UspA family protein